MATEQLTPGVEEQPGRSTDLRDEHVRRFLSDAGVVLSASLDYQETLTRLAELAVPGLADWFSVELLEDGEIRNVAVAHSDPDHVTLARALRQRYPPSLDDHYGVAKVLRSGTPELYEDIPEELLVAATSGPEHLEAVRGIGIRSAVVVPLTARGRVLGALTLVSAESGRRFSLEDLPFFEELARLAALSIDNARLYSEEQKARAEAEEARARIERLQAFTASTAQASSSQEVVEASIRAALEAVGADRGAIYRLSEDGAIFVLVHSLGYGDDLEQDWPEFPADLPGPSREAVETRAPVVVESNEELKERWPHLAGASGAGLRGGVVAVPLETGGHVGWLLVIGFSAAAALTDEERTLLMTMGRQCAHTLERARLYDAERRARADALRMARRLRAAQEVIDAAIAPESLDDLLREVLERVRDALGGDEAAILIRDEETDELVSRAVLGIDPEAHRSVRIPVGSGFAGSIAARREPLIVDDAASFDIYSPVLRGSGVRTLVGVPLIAGEERVVGVLHVGSFQERRFTEEDVLLLRLVATRVALAIEHALLVEGQRQVARTLQRSLLPERLPRVPGLQIAARYVPGVEGLEVGGDWYDALHLGSGRVLFVVGDVVGKGLPAASAMGQLRNALRAYAFEGLEPAEILGRLNELAFEVGRKDLFATVLVSVLEARRGVARLASAGHPPALVLTPQGGPRLVERGRSLPLGAVRETQYEQTTVRIPAESTLLLYTDGLVERRAVRIEDSLERLRRAVRDGPEDVEELLDHLSSTFPPDQHGDDLAMVAVRALGRPVEPLELRYQAKPSMLAPLRGALREWLERAGAADEELHEIVIACNEACTNSIEHPLRAPGDDFFEVEADCAGGELTLVVRDFGRWRDRSPSGDRGRGLKFIHALMDSVDVRSTRTGTEVHMRRRLRPPP